MRSRTGRSGVSDAGKKVFVLYLSGREIPIHVRPTESRGQDLTFTAKMPNGTRLADSDINKLKSAVVTRLAGLESAKWKKFLAVSVETRDSYGEEGAAVELDWSVINRTKLKDGEEVTHDLDGDNVYLHSDPALVPWTQHRQDVLEELTHGLTTLGQRLEEFLSSAKKAKRSLDGVELQRLLTEKTK